MAQTPPTETPPPPTPQTPIRSDTRFWIAFVIIIGLIIILAIPALQGQYAQTTTLAGIFSGWITSIVAFYFYGQTTSQSQSQNAQLGQTANAALKQAEASKNTIDGFKEQMATHDSSMQSLSARRQTKGFTEEVIQQQQADINETTLKQLKAILNQA